VASPSSTEHRSGATASPSAAQARILVAAQKLFGLHGVGGTSLQMIADEIGVTKAAVYHQYNAKEEIVRAVAEAEVDRLEAVLDVAEAESTPSRVRDAAISGVIELAVTRRREVSSLLNDPIIGRLFAKNAHLLEVLDRLNRLLMGPNAGPDSKVATAMLTAALSGATIHPLVVGRDDETLRTQLERLARGFLHLQS
jgi:AcrR family transcriptional regulator